MKVIEFKDLTYLQWNYCERLFICSDNKFHEHVLKKYKAPYINSHKRKYRNVLGKAINNILRAHQNRRTKIYAVKKPN